MLSYFKKLVNWVKKNINDILLTAGIVLVALVSFGTGQLFSSLKDSRPIIIQEPAGPSASIQQSIPNIKENVNKEKVNKAEQGMFIGSINSNKYHWPNCPSAKKIAPQNQIWFNSEKEARAAGYVRCANFDQYAPINYSPE